MQVVLKTGVSFFAWWCASVKSVVSFKTIKNADLQSPTNSILFKQHGYTLRCHNNEDIEFDSFEALGSEINNSPSNYKNGLDLRFDESKYLYRKLSDTYLPDYRILELAELDLISQTPFEHEDVFIIPDSCDGRGRGYYILKKIILSPIIELVEHTKCKPINLSFSTKTGESIFPFEVIKDFKKSNFFSRNLIALCTSIVLMFSAATVLHFHLRYNKAAAELDKQIATVSKDVKDVRSIVASQRELSERLSNVLDLKNNASSTINVWEEFSRVLPDSSWLSVLKVSDDKVTVSGYSRSAASLIEIIDGSPLFSEAGFDGPVVAIAGKDVQRFTIQVRLEK